MGITILLVWVLAGLLIGIPYAFLAGFSPEGSLVTVLLYGPFTGVMLGVFHVGRNHPMGNQIRLFAMSCIVYLMFPIWIKIVSDIAYLCGWLAVAGFIYSLRYNMFVHLVLLFLGAGTWAMMKDIIHRLQERGDGPSPTDGDGGNTTPRNRMGSIDPNTEKDGPLLAI